MRMPHLPTENSGECSMCFAPWPCDTAVAWEVAHEVFCPRGQVCSTHLRPGDRYWLQHPHLPANDRDLDLADTTTPTRTTEHEEAPR